MFDTINGLPLHPLAVHAVVVLLPVAAIVTAIVAARPSLQKYTTWVIGMDAVMMVITFVTKEAGEALEHRIMQIDNGPDPAIEAHAEWGDRVFALSLALFIGSVVLHYVKNRASATMMKVVAALAALGAVLLIGFVVVAGDTGAKAVWEDTIANTKAGVVEGGEG